MTFLTAPPGIPEDEGQYPDWLKREFGYVVQNGRVEYETVASTLLRKFSQSEFWMELSTHLRDIHEGYQIQTGYQLLSNLQPPELLVKSFGSFLNKTYRKNFIKEFKDASQPRTWFGPDLWYERTDDIVRTLFVVKYLDGIEHFLSEIRTICGRLKIENKTEMKANDNGYYAAHIYVRQKIDYASISGGVKSANVWIELQITTQLQEVLRQASHVFYEKLRMSTDAGNRLPWQWRYRDDEFLANNLGHSLHYIEGMIMEVRRRLEGRRLEASASRSQKQRYRK